VVRIAGPALHDGFVPPERPVYDAAMDRAASTDALALTHILLHHRSIRHYRPDPVDPALIDTVCAEAVAGASSSGNLNSVSIVLTRDPERKRRLYEFHFEQPMVLEAPLVMTFCADWYRTRQWLKARGARDNFNNFLGYHVAAFDAMIVAQNVCLGFEARGLGICYMGTTLSAMNAISEFLELPETCVPVTSIVVGYPAEDPARRDRLPYAALLHDERYHRPTADEVEAIFAEREVRGWQRYMSYPELKAEIEKRGITNLAEFYTSDAKYPPDVFAEDSAKIRRLLEEKGFLP
jgi:nitroreductase